MLRLLFVSSTNLFTAYEQLIAIQVEKLVPVAGLIEVNFDVLFADVAGNEDESGHGSFLGNIHDNMTHAREFGAFRPLVDYCIGFSFTPHPIFVFANEGAVMLAFECGAFVVVVPETDTTIYA